jgi:hypothetical protein
VERELIHIQVAARVFARRFVEVGIDEVVHKIVGKIGKYQQERKRSKHLFRSRGRLVFQVKRRTDDAAKNENDIDEVPNIERLNMPDFSYTKGGVAKQLKE